MSQFAPEDSQGSIDLVSNGDITLEADRNQDGAGDLVFRTAGVERARIKHDGTGSGWANVLGGSIPALTGAPSISGDATGATDAAALQTYFNSLSTSGGGVAWLLLPGVYQVNGPLYKPWNVDIYLGPETTIKAVGSFSSSADVIQDSPPTTVASGSNGAATSAATLAVASTTGYPSSGQVRVAISGGTAIVAYTGISGNSFTGCTQAGGAVGTLATGNAVSALSYGTAISGGGIVDSNNLARHALYMHFFAGLTVEATFQNSLQDDIVLGDSAAVSTSYGAMLKNGAGGLLVDRTAGSLPTGYRSVYCTASASDGQFVGRCVVKGQQTGVQVDGSDWRGGIHAWTNGMNICVYDNGLRNAFEVIADTPTQYGLRLGTSQDQGSHRGLAYLNSIYGVDNTVVAVRNDGSLKYNTIDFTVIGADSSHRFASEYTGNYGRGNYQFRALNVVISFRRNLFVADDTSPTQQALTLMAGGSNSNDILRWYAQNSGIEGSLLGAIKANGNIVSESIIQEKIVTPTFPGSGGAVDLDASAGSWQRITVTDTTAFTIHAPSNNPDSTHTTEMTIEIVNSSGGAMGAITWNAGYIFDAGSWTNPASTKKRQATFRWNGTNWISVSVSSADY